jgi:PAS domain S-box-containing protein
MMPQSASIRKQATSYKWIIGRGHLVIDVTPTERRRDHPLLFEALHEIAVAASGVMDSAQLARLAIDQAQQLVGADGAVLRWYDPENDDLRLLAASHDLTSRPGNRKPAETGIGRAFSEGRPVIINDYPNDPRLPTWTRIRGVQAVASVPMMGRDKVLGVLGVVSYRPHQFTQDDVRILTLLAAVVAPAIESARLHDALLRRESELAGIYDGLAYGVIVRDSASRVVEVNASARAFFGPKLVDDLFAGIHPPFFAEDGSPLPSAEAPIALAFKLRRAVPARIIGMDLPSGKRVWMRSETVAMLGADGAVERVVTSFVDISDRKDAEDALRLSEARNAAIVETALDCIVVMDADGLVVEFNPTAQLVFGHRREDVIGRQLADVIIPERLRGGHHAGLERQRKGGPSRILGRRVEQVAMRSDGTEFPVELAISRLDTGRGSAYSASIRDLSVRDQLRESQARLAEVLASAPVVLWAIDGHGVVTAAAGLALQLFGLTPEVAIGADVFKLLKAFPDVVAHIRRALAGEASAVRLGLAATGATLDARFDPVRDEQGDVVGITSIATDITEVVRAEAARQQGEAKSRLAAIVNHEVRTPLNSILGFAELLSSERAGPLNDKQRRWLENIDVAGQHLLALVNDSLDLSKIDSGGMLVNLEELDLAAVLLQAGEQVQPIADARGIKLRIDCPEGPRVRADSRRMLQILLNLLSNATRHTPAKGRVTISARGSAKVVRISISDTGIGIPADQQERIFEEFVQVEGSTGGTGLGLPVSRRLAQLMGGDIRVHSELGHGSTFTVTLPACPKPAGVSSPGDRKPSPGVHRPRVGR